MTVCISCAKKLESDWNFCPNCGKHQYHGLDSPPETPRDVAAKARERARIFEVVVRQALGGAPWRAICAGPMVVNQITESEVEEEVRRRRGEIDGIEAKAALEGDMSRELNRTRVDLSPKQPPGPHHINWGNNS